MIYRGYWIARDNDSWLVKDGDGRLCATLVTEDQAMAWVDATKRKEYNERPQREHRERLRDAFAKGK